jgi:hypothetical protein
MYAETSYALRDSTGYKNPTPTHFQHIADYFEHRRILRLQHQMRQAR